MDSQGSEWISKISKWFLVVWIVVFELFLVVRSIFEWFLVIVSRWFLVVFGAL